MLGGMVLHQREPAAPVDSADNRLPWIERGRRSVPNLAAPLMDVENRSLIEHSGIGG